MPTLSPRRACVLPLLLAANAATCLAQEAPASARATPNELLVAAREQAIVDDYVVRFNGIDAPARQIVLIRNGKARCAIRYLSFSRGHDEKPATAFDSGGESFDAEAEFLPDSSKTVQKRHLSIRPSTGAAKVIVSGHSDNKISCGHGELLWIYPTGTVFDWGDADTWAAPAHTEDFARIDFDDRTLVWVKFEKDRRQLVIKR